MQRIARLAACALAVGACTPDTFGGDSGSSADAGADAGGDAGGGDGGGASWCASQSPKPMFCDDFDTVAGVGFGWTGMDQGSGATVAFDPIASSSPHSALTALVGDDAGSCRYARLQKSFPQQVTSMHYAFDVRPGNAAGDGGFPDNNLVAAVVEDPGATGEGTCIFVLGSDPSGGKLALQVNLADGGSIQGFQDGLTAYPLLGKFSRVQIDLDLAAGNVAVSVDGLSALAARPIPTFCMRPAVIDIQVGPYCVGQATEFRFDNVTYNAN